MRVLIGTKDIPTAGTELQISNTADKVKSIAVKARSTNTGSAFLGISDVGATNGWTLLPGEAVALDFGDGSIAFSVFYLDVATSGDDIDWAAVLE